MIRNLQSAADVRRAHQWRRSRGFARDMSGRQVQAAPATAPAKSAAMAPDIKNAVEQVIAAWKVQRENPQDCWSTPERVPAPTVVYVDACLRSSQGPQHDLLILRRADKRDTAGTFPLVVITLSSAMKASGLGLIKVLGKTPAEMRNPQRSADRTHTTFRAPVRNSAALGKHAASAARAARRRVTCYLMDVNMVPNSVSGHARALAYLWSPAMKARYGNPPAPSTICRWRTQRRRSAMGPY